MEEIFVHSLNTEYLNEPRYIQIVIPVTLDVVGLLNPFVLVLNWAFRRTSGQPLVFFAVEVTIIRRLVVQVAFVVDEMYMERGDM